MKTILNFLKKMSYKLHRRLVKADFSYTYPSSFPIKVFKYIFLGIRYVSFLFVGSSILLLYLFNIDLSEYVAIMRDKFLYYAMLINTGSSVIGPFLLKCWLKADKLFSEYFGQPKSPQGVVEEESSEWSDKFMDMSQLSRVFDPAVHSLPESSEDEDGGVSGSGSNRVKPPVVDSESTKAYTSRLFKSSVQWSVGIFIVAMAFAGVGYEVYHGRAAEVVMVDNSVGTYWLTLTGLTSLFVLVGSVPLAEGEAEGEEHWPDKELDKVVNNTVEPGDANAKISKFKKAVVRAIWGDSDSDSQQQLEDVKIFDERTGAETPTPRGGVTPKASTSDLPSAEIPVDPNSPEVIKHVMSETSSKIEKFTHEVNAANRLLNWEGATDAQIEQATKAKKVFEHAVNRERGVYAMLEDRLKVALPRTLSAEEAAWREPAIEPFIPTPEPSAPAPVQVPEQASKEASINRQNSPEVAEWDALRKSTTVTPSSTAVEQPASLEEEDDDTLTGSLYFPASSTIPSELGERSESNTTLRPLITNTPVDHEPSPSTPATSAALNDDEVDDYASDSSSSSGSDSEITVDTKNQNKPLGKKGKK